MGILENSFALGSCYVSLAWLWVYWNRFNVSTLRAMALWHIEQFYHINTLKRRSNPNDREFEQYKEQHTYMGT